MFPILFAWGVVLGLARFEVPMLLLNARLQSDDWCSWSAMDTSTS